MSIRVLLVDDQEMVRTGFRMILGTEDDFEVVGEAADGERAVWETERLQPDVVLMDVQMPVLDGISATRRIVASETLGTAKVLILTTFERDDYIWEALQAGASGFLLKNASPEELINAIRVVAGGDSRQSSVRAALDRIAAGADRVVAVPIYGRAESLNLATAAAVCLYATARARAN